MHNVERSRVNLNQVEAFGADAANRYSGLSDVAEKVKDEEDYEEWSGYPDFIERIELVATSEDEVRFVVWWSNLNRHNDRLFRGKCRAICAQPSRQFHALYL